MEAVLETEVNFQRLNLYEGFDGIQNCLNINEKRIKYTFRGYKPRTHLHAKSRTCVKILRHKITNNTKIVTAY